MRIPVGSRPVSGDDRRPPGFGPAGRLLVVTIVRVANGDARLEVSVLGASGRLGGLRATTAGEAAEKKEKKKLQTK